MHPEKGDGTIGVNPWLGEGLLPVAGEEVNALVIGEELRHTGTPVPHKSVNVTLPC